MRVLHLRWSVPLAATVIIVGASVAFGAFRDNFTKPAAPVPGRPAVAQLTMTGGGFQEDTIDVLGLDFKLKREFGTGQGAALCRGVRFRKPTDRWTPALFEAISANAVIGRRFSARGASSSR